MKMGSHGIEIAFGLVNILACAAESESKVGVIVAKAKQK